MTWDFPGKPPAAFYRYLTQLVGEGFLSNPANRVLQNVYIVYDATPAREIAALVEAHGGKARRFGVRVLDTSTADGTEMDAARERVGQLMTRWSKRGPKPGRRR